MEKPVVCTRELLPGISKLPMWPPPPGETSFSGFLMSFLERSHTFQESPRVHGQNLNLTTVQHNLRYKFQKPTASVPADASGKCKCLPRGTDGKGSKEEAAATMTLQTEDRRKDGGRKNRAQRLPAGHHQNHEPPEKR